MLTLVGYVIYKFVQILYIKNESNIDLKGSDKDGPGKHSLQSSTSSERCLEGLKRKTEQSCEKGGKQGSWQEFAVEVVF